MKKLLFLSALGILLVGCRSRYDITLSNGNKFTGVSKPVLDKKTDLYKFTSGNGQQMSVPAARVRVIEPHGESSEPQFKVPSPKK